MRDLKYIIVTLSEYLEPRAIIFNGLINHSEIWLGVQHQGNVELVSAGFCDLFEMDKVRCWGESESIKHLSKDLAYKSRPLEDSIIIFRTLSKSHVR